MDKIYVMINVISGLNVETDVFVNVYSTKEKAIKALEYEKIDSIRMYPYFKVEEDNETYFKMVSWDWEDELEVYIMEKTVDGFSS